MASQYWWTISLVGAILIHVISSGLHASASGVNGNTATDLGGDQQFSMLRDGSMASELGSDLSSSTSGGGANTNDNYEQTSPIIIPTSRFHSTNSNFEFNPRTNRLLAVPDSLSRLLFSNMRIPSQLVDKAVASQSPQSSGLSGLKRSANALDMITGVTFGKRSVGSPSGSGSRMNIVNYEPLTYRHAPTFIRTTPRMYDLGRHWTGSYELATPFESQSNA